MGLRSSRRRWRGSSYSPAGNLNVHEPYKTKNPPQRIIIIPIVS